MIGGFSIDPLARLSVPAGFFTRSKKTGRYCRGGWRRVIDARFVPSIRAVSVRRQAAAPSAAATRADHESIIGVEMVSGVPT
jgi:hypothetical protein